jgi:hypothetical protein
MIAALLKAAGSRATRQHLSRRYHVRRHTLGSLIMSPRPRFCSRIPLIRVGG